MIDRFRSSLMCDIPANADFNAFFKYLKQW